MASRIQRKRSKGWRMPEGVVYVGRPSKWGNPYNFGPSARAKAVNRFRAELLAGAMPVSVEEIRAELAGKDLACWCPLDEPCHADVLLEVANG